MPHKFKVYVHRSVCLCVDLEGRISVVLRFLSVFLFKILHFLKQCTEVEELSSGMLRRVALVRTDVSEEPSAFFIRVTRIGELGTIFSQRTSAVSCSLCCS
jgi:hypothetical protein